MYHIFFIHSSAGGRLGYFHVLSIINSATVNIRAHVFFFKLWFFSGYMPSSGITGLYDRSISSFHKAEKVTQKKRTNMNTKGEKGVG